MLAFAGHQATTQAACLVPDIFSFILISLVSRLAIPQNPERFLGEMAFYGTHQPQSMEKLKDCTEPEREILLYEESIAAKGRRAASFAASFGCIASLSSSPEKAAKEKC
ncbi:hypothetical protein L345_07905, partial [Ophiophagus hannah]